MKPAPNPQPRRFRHDRAIAHGWRDPVAAMAAWADEPYALLLASDGGPHGRWSVLARAPDRADALWADDPRRPESLLRDLLGPAPAPAPADAAPGPGVFGLAAYELGERFERLGLARDPDWPDLTLARYPAVLVFDHHRRAVTASATGATPEAAASASAAAVDWLAEPPRPLCAATDDAPAARFEPEDADAVYEAAVADVTRRIAAGELFQANIARAWTGRLAPGRRPWEVFARLVRQSPAPFAAWWRLPGRALVSHSPERFVSLEPATRTAEARPIKGTRPRGRDPVEDAGLAEDLRTSPKDRAENLMIVDLMRNDLSRVCVPGTVTAPDLLALERYAQVQHLVSTVRGRLSPGRDAADLIAATFPPGSITGAPKVQAMRVIARHERPRGPWCGTLFRTGFDGGMDSSVLIRTAAFVEDADGWRFRTLAGAGIVSDSDPRGERLETEAKIEGLRRALIGPA